MSTRDPGTSTQEEKIMKIGNGLLFSAKVLAAILLGIVAIAGVLLAICFLGATLGLFFHPLIAVPVALGPLWITYVAYSLIRKIFDDSSSRIDCPKQQPLSNAEACRRVL